ncbi:unnamed protein product, partial [Thlaspi arvense]
MVRTRLTIRDAIKYVLTVRDTFQDNREIYDTFLVVMKNFKAKRISRSIVIAKVKKLFKGKRELILAFNKFLPKGYKITFKSDETPVKRSVYAEAIRFVIKVEKTLQDDRAYGSFLEILQMHSQNKKSVSEVYNEVYDGLFRDQPELRMEFAYFLPH